MWMVSSICRVTGRGLHIPAKKNNNGLHCIIGVYCLLVRSGSIPWMDTKKKKTKTNVLAVWSQMGLRALASFIRVEQHRGQKIQRRRRAGTGQRGKRRGPALASKARSRSRQPPPIDATHDRFALLRLLAGGNEEPGGRPGNECAPALGVPCSGHHHCCIKSGDCGL